MENKDKLWLARSEHGALCAYNSKPERDCDYGIWKAEWFYDMFSFLPKNLFPDLTWEDEPIEVELRPAITDLDEMANEYADKVTDNEEIKKLIINAFKAGYEI